MNLYHIKHIYLYPYMLRKLKAHSGRSVSPYGKKLQTLQKFITNPTDQNYTLYLLLWLLSSVRIQEVQFQTEQC